MRRTEYLCDICGEVIPRGQAALGFEFACGRLPGDDDIFDFQFDSPHSVERHWCGRCLRGIARMAPQALIRLKTIGGAAR